MRKTVVTLGTFDGVHRGHQALLNKVVTRARAIKAKSVVLAFGMPPRHAGEPSATQPGGRSPAVWRPVLLTTLPEKIRLLKQYGIDQVEVLVFDRKTASTLPEDFFRETLLKKHHAQEMVVGPRVAFGKNRAGRLPLLRRLGRQHGVRIHVVSSIARGRRAISSRRIRALLSQGHLEQANKLLGYPYTVEGKVVHGDHRGRRLGFPTANIQVNPGKILPRGVYWVKVEPIGVDGLCNVGVRPTFAPHSHVLHCEVFLLKKSPSLYGRKLRIVFLRRIRPERRFSSADALKTTDCKRPGQSSALQKCLFFDIITYFKRKRLIKTCP